MKALIVGLGSIGKRHLLNLKHLEPKAHIIVLRHNRRLQNYEDINSIVDAVVFSLEDALNSSPDIALITNPSSMHLTTAKILANGGINLFIEKPISDTLEGVDELIALCNERKLTLQIGYNFRFYEPLRLMRKAVKEGRVGRPISLRAEVGQYLPSWRPEIDYWRTPSARSDLGGGAVLELSHELDYVPWILDDVETVFAQIGRLGELDIDVEDTAEIILKFCNGAFGSVHLDMLNHISTRTLRIIGTDGTLDWNGINHQVNLFSAASTACTELHPISDLDKNLMYIAELQHFLKCVREPSEPVVNGDDGRNALRLALAIKRSALEGQEIVL